MSTLMQAHKQWLSRPADERFTSLIEMQQVALAARENSREIVISSKQIECIPDEDNQGLQCAVKGELYAPNHWSFGQLAQLAEAPAGYLRTLPSPIAADCINYGMQFKRDISDIGLLLYNNGSAQLRASTGPRYGRIWNADLITALVERFGDGINGQFRVPGEFGKQVAITKDNTTLYMGDRNMFVFLADEEHRIEVPNRRNGQTGQMARGFFMWNSEVGSEVFGLATFLFDYVCCNRIVWGAEQFKEVRIRHTASAPDKWLDEMQPAIEQYAQSSTVSITKAIEDAKEAKLGDKLNDFLASRFTRKIGDKIKLAHREDEDRPIETKWDVVVGATAYARSLKNQDVRVEIEREAGKILSA